MFFEIACDDVVQMDAVFAKHIVPVAGVSEEVGVSIGIDAGTDEAECVLRHADGVIQTVDNHKTPLQIGGLVD